MKHYVDYMDRQTLSPERLHKLEQLRPRPQRPWRSWRRWGALAACCAVLVGLGLSMTRPVQTSPVELPPASAAQSTLEKERLLPLPRLAFRDNSAKRVMEDAAPEPAIAPTPAASPVQSPEPEADGRAALAEQFGGKIPDVLGWEDFEVHSRGGEPDAPCLYVSGQAEEFSFDLAVQEGKIPDGASTDGEITEYCGVEIAGVKQAEDLYEVSLLTPDEVGVYYSVKGEDGPEWTAALVWALLAPKGED